MSFKNNSMLREHRERIIDDGLEEACRRFQVFYLDKGKTHATLGHLYSVMLEELRIPKAEIPGFIASFKTILEKTNANSTDLYEQIWDKEIRALDFFLNKQNLSKNSYQRIMFEAFGWPNQNYVDSHYVYRNR